MDKKPKKEHYIFHRYSYEETPDIFVSDEHNYNDAIFDFVFQTLGYAIIKAKSEDDAIEVSEV